MNRTMRRWVLTAATACAPLTALPAGAWAQATNTTANLIYYDAAGNETLDPAEPQNNSSLSHEALLAIYDTLIRMGADGVPGPGMVASWERNADLTDITLKLRPDVVFHDGAKLDAEAVKKNLERSAALGKRAGNTVQEAVGLITAIEVVDPLTVRLKLKAPSGQIEYWLGANPGMMLSPAAFNGDAMGNNIKPIGAGPYKLKSVDPNVRTITTRYDGYWGGTAGRPAGFEHHYVPDGRARLNALRSGQATIALIDPRQMTEAKGAGLAIQINQKNMLWDIYPNTSRAGLGDIRVRRAIMHAIDREALAEALGFGSAKPTQQLFAESSPYYVAELNNHYKYDPAMAKALLAEAGFKDGIDITQLLLNNSEYRQLAEALQAMLAESGIRIKFDVVDVSQFPLFFRQPPRGDILMARYGGRSDPVQTVFELVGTGGSYAPAGAVSPEIDKLITQLKGMAGTDPKRTPVMRDLAKVIVETVATIPVITRANVYAYRPGCIQNLQSYLPAGDDRFNDVTIAANCK